MVFFAKRMLEIEADGRYADILEKELYNGTISGISLDGKRYFYVNPLESNPGYSGKLFGQRHVVTERPGWYACACCPPNLVRMVTALGGYAWTENDDTMYSHLLIGQRAELQNAVVEVESSYPWEGKVSYRISPKKEQFTLAIHIPHFVKINAEGISVKINGERVAIEENLKKGYLYLDRAWKEGDTVEVLFDLPVRKVFANQKVVRDAGCVALLRGPIVYCFEGVDNGEDIQALRIPKVLEATAYTVAEGVLKGITCLKMPGYKMETDEELYSEKRPEKKEVTLTAVPYYAWANRGENQMRVWMMEEV